MRLAVITGGDANLVLTPILTAPNAPPDMCCIPQYHRYKSPRTPSFGGTGLYTAYTDGCSLLHELSQNESQPSLKTRLYGVRLFLRYSTHIGLSSEVLWTLYWESSTVSFMSTIMRHKGPKPASEAEDSGPPIVPSRTSAGPAIPKPLRTLLQWNSLPQWQRGNNHIHRGYRPASSSFFVSFRSLSYLHNETVNIYTHLLPSLVTIPFSVHLYRALSPRYATATYADIIAFSCFFAGASFCLGMSAIYHTISNHSTFVARIGNAFDYVGIVGLIMGSFIPSIYYVFYCHPHLQCAYWVMISGIGLGCIVVSIIPRFQTPELRTTRATVFVSIGLSAIFPVLHGLWLFGFERMKTQIGLNWVLLQGFLYILGATIYAERVPERLRPGKFDILGNSHQIFHVLVVLAALGHLKGLLEAFDFRHSGVAAQC